MSEAVYIVPVVCLVAALACIIVILVVLIRRRKRKRSHGHLSQLQKSGQFSPVSPLSPQSVSAAYSDPLEFPRNQLHVFTKRVLGTLVTFPGLCMHTELLVSHLARTMCAHKNVV